MANYTLKQHNYSDPGSGSPITVVFTSAQSAGSINIVGIGWTDTTHTISSVADTKNGTYSLAIGPTQNTVQGITQSIYYFPAIVAAGASANTVTVTFSASVPNPDVRIAEFSSTNGTSWTVDKTKGQAANDAAGGANSVTTTATTTTTNANDLLYGCFTVNGGISLAGSGYTSIDITSPDTDIHEYQEVSVTGAYAATANGSPAGQYVGQVVAFNAAAGGGGTVTLSCAITAHYNLSAKIISVLSAALTSRYNLGAALKTVIGAFTLTSRYVLGAALKSLSIFSASLVTHMALTAKIVTGLTNAIVVRTVISANLTGGAPVTATTENIYYLWFGISRID